MTQEHRNKSGFETRAIHAGYEPDPTTGAVIPPIYATSTYKQDGVGGLRGGYEYSRSANPTRTALEANIAALEEGERGFAFASGLAAEDTLLRALTRPGDHLVFPDDAYGGTFRLVDKVAGPWGLAHTPAQVADVDAMRAAIRPGETRLVWVETPTNPMLTIGDIEALASVAHDGFARTIRPVHTMHDGDTIFALATGAHERSRLDPAELTRLAVFAVDAVERAVLGAVRHATAMGGLPAAGDEAGA